MKKKIAGVSWWIWLLGICVLVGIGCIALPKIQEATQPKPLELVQDAIWRNARGDFEIRGTICNPRKDPARKVAISYDVSVANLKSKTKRTIGPAIAEIQYIPAGGSVDFSAVSSYTMNQWDVAEKGKATISESTE